MNKQWAEKNFEAIFRDPTDEVCFSHELAADSMADVFDKIKQLLLSGEIVPADSELLEIQDKAGNILWIKT